jgi:hypothetical protein
LNHILVESLGRGILLVVGEEGGIHLVSGGHAQVIGLTRFRTSEPGVDLSLAEYLLA